MATARSELGERTGRDEFAAHVLGVLPGAVLAVLADRGVIPERIALIVFAVSYVGLNLMHMAATWSRSYLDSETWRRAPLVHVVIPIALGAGALTFEALGGAVLLLGVQYYLSIHHGAMQNYGIVRQSQRRSGRTLDGDALRLDQAACLLPLIAALAFRARSLGATYDQAPLWSPPAWLVFGLTGAAVVAVTGWIAREIRAVRAGHRVDPIEPALVIGVPTTWIALLLGLKNAALPFFAIASGHYVQYLFFVRRFELRRSALTALPVAVRQNVGPERPVRYYLALFVFGGAVVAILTAVAVGLRIWAKQLGLRPDDALAVPPWAAAMMAVNLHHYWLDGRIWRRPAMGR